MPLKVYQSSIYSRPEALEIWTLATPPWGTTFARSSFVGTPGFCRQAAECLRELRPGLARCLEALERYTVLHRTHAHRLVAATVSTNPHSPSFDEEVTALAELGVKVGGKGTEFEYLVTENSWESQSSYDELAIRSLLTLGRRAFLRILTIRLKRQSLVSWNGNELPSQSKGYVDYSGQIFTAYGFSWLAPLVRVNEAKNEFPALY